MDWAWFNALPAALQQVLTGAAAEYAALAGPALYAAARSRITTAHRAAQQQQAAVQAAIQRALQDALLQSLPALTDDPEQMRHHLDLLGGWLARPAWPGRRC